MTSSADRGQDAGCCRGAINLADADRPSAQALGRRSHGRSDHPSERGFEHIGQRLTQRADRRLRGADCLDREALSEFCAAGLAAARAALLLPDRRELGADRDGVTDAARDRALVSVEAVHALHHGQVHAGVHGEQVADVDPLDYQDAALQLDLSFGICPETTASGGDTARF